MPYSKRHTKSHTLCRRCGNRAFHKQHKGMSFWSILLCRSILIPVQSALSAATPALSCGRTSGARRPSAERRPALAACVTSSTSQDVSRTASGASIHLHVHRQPAHSCPQGEHPCSQADQDDDGGISVPRPHTTDCTARAGGSFSSRIASHPPYMSCPLYTATQVLAQAAATRTKYMS